LAINDRITANQQKLTQANQRFATVAERYRKDARRNSGDMIAAVRDQVNQLSEAREDLKQLTAPASVEGKAFYDAYLQLLDNQIKAWEAEGRKLAQALDDPAKAKEFDQFLHRLEEQRNADLARVKETQQAFLAAQGSGS
jgi:hypothetical protein